MYNHALSTVFRGIDATHLKLTIKFNWLQTSFGLVLNYQFLFYVLGFRMKQVRMAFYGVKYYIGPKLDITYSAADYELYFQF